MLQAIYSDSFCFFCFDKRRGKKTVSTDEMHACNLHALGFLAFLMGNHGVGSSFIFLL
jgi:hypothetical protein